MEGSFGESLWLLLASDADLRPAAKAAITPSRSQLLVQVLTWLRAFEATARSIKLKCYLGQNDDSAQGDAKQPTDRSGNSHRQRAANGNSQRGPKDRRTAEVTTKRTERRQTCEGNHCDHR